VARSEERSDPRTVELRAAHDVLAEFYAERLVGHHESMPVEQAVLGLFGRLAGAGAEVADIGAGSGRIAPHLAALGLRPRGLDLSEEMVRVARRDFPGFAFEVGDVRALPYDDGALGGAVCWYSLMYLPPEDRPAAYAELARVLRPGAPLAVAFKAGDGSPRRGGLTLDLGIVFDIWWHDPEVLRAELEAAGFATVMWAGRPAAVDEPQPQGYLVLSRR
jgi:ubiquinone/menaquinone biosynthesis C-methylase UbiE